MWLLLICSLFHPRFCSDGSVPPPPRCSRHHRAPRRIHACDKSIRFIYQAGLYVGIIHHACSTGVIDRRQGSVGQTGHVLCLRVTEAARTCRTCLFHSLVSNADVIVCEHMNLFHPSFLLGFEKKKFSISCAWSRFHKCWDAVWIVKKKNVLFWFNWFTVYLVMNSEQMFGSHFQTLYVSWQVTNP